MHQLTHQSYISRNNYIVDSITRVYIIGMNAENHEYISNTLIIDDINAIC